MRIGLVCPYSLTVPGGVQSQVLGLARSLRSLDHDVRVLGPCDGPPPDAGVTPLGNSIPTPANGSVAPLAPDPSAQLRFIRAVRDEGFDLLHLHEPLAPGCTMTACVLKPVPLVGTFHAAGMSASYKWGRVGVRWLASKLDLRCVVSDDALELAERYLGGTYERVFNGIELAPFAEAVPAAADGPTILFLGRHEERKGLSVLLEAMTLLPRDVRLWIAGDGPETEQLKRRLGRRSPDRVAGPDHRRAEGVAHAGGERLLRALPAGRVVRGGPARGHGVVHADRGQRSTRIPQSGQTGTRRDARAPRRRGRSGRGCSSACSTTTPPLEALAKSRPGARAEEFSMDHLAARYVELYEQVVAAGAEAPRRPVSA